MHARRPLTHWLLLLALVAMWGSSFLFTKIAVAAFAPTGIVAARLVLGAAVLLGLVLLSGRALPRDGRSWRFFALMAIFGYCIPFFLITWGQQRIDSGLAGILMAVMPLTTVLLAHLFVAGERMTRAKGAGFLLGFLGIVVLMGPEALLASRGGGTALLYELAVLGGAICYAVNTIIARRRPAGDASVAAAGVTLLAGLLMVPTAAATGGFAVAEIAPLPAAAVAFLGLVSTALAGVVYFKLVAAAGPSFLSLINYLIPLWAVLIGAAFLGEEPEWSALAALALILSGIGLSERRGRVKDSAVPPG
jgi:drug/metabolite transporter (DMT)-like permease